MCGIFAVIGRTDTEKLKILSKRMSHRGPDENGMQVVGNATLLHERLSIIDVHTGKQPIAGNNGNWMVHNGEIYNHQELRETILKEVCFQTKSDSEVIVHLYEKFGEKLTDHLDGVFAFVVVTPDGKFIAGRDPIGVKPMYWGKDAEGNLYFSSEMKCISDQCVEMKAFPPGYIMTHDKGLIPYFKPKWDNYQYATEELDYGKLRESLERAVEKRLMTDVPLGLLLSGGLDSSLISAIAARKLKTDGQQIHSFSVGLNPDAPDLIAAREVAEMIGSTHHEITYSLEEGLAEIEQLIWHTESYDITTVRASTPMYLMSKYIQKEGIRVVLSGEGADEIFGGYLYFHNAPSEEELQKELIRRVKLLSTADCLRADKSTMAFGLEARVPFLDKQFLEVAMCLKPEFKTSANYQGVEKYILRKAFDDKNNPYIPENILWRQKEQFSDGVGYNWIDTLIGYCESMVDEAEFAKAAELFPYNTPQTKEGFYYRKIFEKHFPEKHAAQTVNRWIPKWQENTDPSGRANRQHTKGDMSELENS